MDEFETVEQVAPLAHDQVAPLVFEEIDPNEAGAFLALSYEEEPR